MTIYFLTHKENGLLFMPNYSVVVKNPEPVRIYYGVIENCADSLTLEEILSKYYDGDLFMLLWSMTWGGYESRDVDILEDMGATYRTYYQDLPGDGQNYYVFKNGRWKKTQPVNPVTSIEEYLNDKQALVEQIHYKIAPRDMGWMTDASSREYDLDEIADIPKGKMLNKYYINPPEVCDICKFRLSSYKYMIDGKLEGSTAWANMCPDCFIHFGEAIGWGSGQLYLRQGNKWLLVGGFKEDSEEEI